MIYDKNVNLSFLTGANKQYIEERIPHIAALMSSEINEVLSFSELIVIGNKSEEFKEILLMVRPDQYVLDFVRVKEEIDKEMNYEGICW